VLVFEKLVTNSMYWKAQLTLCYIN